MKQAFSIFFALLFLLLSIQKTLVFGFYELEKEYVIEKLCVNKDVKNSCCFGKCFVDKQTSEKEAEGIIINSLKNIKDQFFCAFQTSTINIPFEPIQHLQTEKVQALSEYHETKFQPPRSA